MGFTTRFLVCLAFAVMAAELSDASCLKSKKIDLQILVDSSDSVTKPNFQKMMKAIANDVVNEMEIGEGKGNVALYVYSHVMEKEFGLKDHLTKEAVKEALVKTQFIGGATRTGKAMEEALKIFDEDSKKDEDALKFCLVFTDGQASDRSMVPAASSAWRKKGVKIFAIGIGNQIDLAGLTEIAGTADHVIQLKSFDEIGSVAQQLFGKVCQTVKPEPLQSAFRCESGHEVVQRLGFFKITPIRVNFVKPFVNVPAFTWGITKAVDDAKMEPTWANVWMKDGLDKAGASMGALVYDSGKSRNILEFSWMACGV